MKCGELPYAANKILKVCRKVSVIMIVTPKAALTAVCKPGKRLTGKSRHLELNFVVSVCLLMSTACH